MCQILIADADKSMQQVVEQILKNEGYTVLAAHSAESAMEIVRRSSPDLILIDLSLPNAGGVELCRKLRANAETADNPIIFLTSQNDSYNVVQALESGGDDYIRKPFAVRELTARIRAHLRRYNAYMNENSTALRIVSDTYQVFVDDREVMLTRIEFDLLCYLANHVDKWHSTQELLTNVWSYPEGIGDTALVRNHIRNLRRKLENDPDHPAIIQSRHGRGYAVRAKVEFAEHVI
ncbi:MAG: cell wall metabolism DNA-binding response regulator WalR [Anaerolineae bacterium]